MQFAALKGKTRYFTAVFVALIFAFSGVASAASVGSEYTYNFNDASGVVPNAATANNAVNLSLYGNWASVAGGVSFDGNTTGKQSVGYAKPAAGSTINVLASESVGGQIKFTYKAPATGTCFKDSVNLTQIGRFAANTAQLKIQLSKCGKGVLQTNVYPECRVAGALTPGTVLPVRGSQALISGEQYAISCIKSADPISGKPTVQIKTAQLLATGNITTLNTFLVAKTGAINSTGYLSVANKYPLPSIVNNTDQYVGTVAAVTFCKLATTALVTACLESEVPLAL